MSSKAVSDVSGKHPDITDDFLKTLEQSEFFQQMGDLKGSLASVAGELSALGNRASRRAEEVETLAAHIMAIEAVLAVMLKSHPVDPALVREEVARRSGHLSGDPDGSPTVQAVAFDILGNNPNDNR